MEERTGYSFGKKDQGNDVSLPEEVAVAAGFGKEGSKKMLFFWRKKHSSGIINGLYLYLLVIAKQSKMKQDNPAG